ncbi:DUF4340 domain-containing protein [Magnetococcus sp. PR-3]|uniref:DUF4340 domain-containing protein n=1 Tax=Magnetococcus sp. PR-3 TaxID=3120355 RepID=UPI002FCDE70B
MTRPIRLLTLALVAQLILALVLWGNGPDLKAVTPNAPLFMLQDAQIDEIFIEGEENQQVILKQQDGLWVLPNHHLYPAQASEVTALLNQLKGLNHGTPMATTTGAQARFKVSDTAYNRRITLKQNQTELAKLYLGNSQGTRRSTARLEGEQNIYSVTIALHQVPQTAKAWEDKTLLQIPAPEITQIKTHGLTITRNPVDEQTQAPQPRWQVEGMKAGEQVNFAALESLTNKLANLRIEEVLGLQAKPEYGLEKPVWQATVTPKGKAPVTYQLGYHAATKRYTLKRTDRPEYFQLPLYVAEGLKESAQYQALIAQP